MRLTALVSPGIWDLLDRLRPHLDVTVEVFDQSLAPLLPDSGNPVATELRRRAGLQEEADGEVSPRARLAAAVRTGQHLILSAPSLHVGLFPLRHDRTVAGVLAVGASAASAGPGPEDSAERRVERVGWSLRAALEADIATSARLSDEQQLSRWLSAILSFLEHLESRTSESELFASVVEAAAIWGDFDARVYERGLEGRYVMRTALPGLQERPPHGFPAQLLEAHPGVARISSVAELERLGWTAPQGELLLLPVGTETPPRWVLTFAGAVDARFERVFAAVGRALGGRLAHLTLAARRALIERLAARLADAALGFEGQAAALLGELASAVSAAQARLLVQDADTGAPRVLASVGGGPFVPLPPVLGTDRLAAELNPGRLTLPLAVGLAGPALLELTAAAGHRFSATDAELAETGAGFAEPWLAGALKGLAGSGVASLPGLIAHGFEGRIQEEIERARRFNLEAALLVIDTGFLPPDHRHPGLAPLVDALRAHVRASDLVGRLADGQMAVLLVHTDARAMAAVTARLQAGLAALPEPTAPSGRPAVGRSAYPAAGETAKALIAAARADLEGRRRRADDVTPVSSRG